MSPDRALTSQLQPLGQAGSGERPPAARRPGWATPYRMMVTTPLPHDNAVSLVDRQLASWLKAEGHPTPPQAAADRPCERLRLADRVLLDRDCGVLLGAAGRYTRRRLRTPLPYGTHQMTITVASGSGTELGWFRLEAEHLPADPHVRPPGRVPVPEPVRGLLPLLDATDGPVAVDIPPRVISAGGVDGLIDELCDPDRRLPVVVLSVPQTVEVESWLLGTAQPLLHQLPGLAVCYVLDHSALPRLNLALEYHKVYGGAVRTYLPEVDPASRLDGARHPVLPRHRIEEDLRRAAGLLAREPRQYSAGRPVPELLAAVPPFQVPSQIRQLVPSQKTHLGLRQVGVQLRVTARRLCTATGPVPAVSGRPAVRDDGVPVSFGELVRRFAEFPLLEFTGDEKEALALDGRRDGAGWARLAWEGLTALQEYASAAVRGEANGDFKQWCEHTPAGCHRFPPRKAVRGESRTVESHSKWKRERMLPVPECVDASRRAFMGAHLRIGGGRTAPRLHYLDDCSGSGRIYVGYIGLHLTNTLTN